MGGGNPGSEYKVGQKYVECLYLSFVFVLVYYSDHMQPEISTLKYIEINPLKPELNSICYLLALLAHHFLHVSRIRVKSLTFRRLMSYIYIWSTHS